MDFWARQEQAKRYTLLLGMLFLLAVVLTIFLMNMVVGVFLFVFRGAYSVFIHEYSLIILLAMLAVILLGSCIEWFRLREGGRALAARLNARRIFIDATVPEEQLLKNVVEELSIASGVPAPALYVLDDEQGVNAFVAGYMAYDRVLVVTWGMLQTLDRYELQGVIAHEYSHIRQGDTALNLRLMALLSGLLSISMLGSWIAQTGFAFDRSLKRERYVDGPFIILGGLIWLIGSTGVLMARLIKFAILRQREYFADAASVQFTRSYGVLQALLRIRAHHVGTQLHGVYTESISHFCFAQALNQKSWFSTHPDLDDRILEINPAALRRALVQDRILARKLSPQDEEDIAQEDLLLPAKDQEPIEWQAPAPLPRIRLNPVSVGGKDAVKPLNPELRMTMARPDVIKRALSTPTGCRELLAAILALRQQVSCEPEQQQISRAIVEGLAKIDSRLYFSIFLQAVERLGELPASVSRQLLTRLADIIQLDQHIGLMDVLLLEHVKAKLDQLPPVVPVAMENCAVAIARLVEALLHVQRLHPEQIDMARARVLKTILSRQQLESLDLQEVIDGEINLGQVLQQLSGLLRREKMNVLAVAETCLWVDTHMTQEEQDVLDLLYWRLGFEAKSMVDHKAQLMSLEV